MEFQPFRFPTSVAFAFELPLEHLHVSSEKHAEFKAGTGQRAPKEIVGAVQYLLVHYLVPNQKTIMDKGRHMLMISLCPGGRWHRPACRAWWESLSSLRAKYAPVERALAHDRGYCESTFDDTQILKASAVRMLESYDVLSTVIVQWDVTTLPDEQCAAVGAFPLHCFDAPGSLPTKERSWVCTLLMRTLLTLRVLLKSIMTP